MANLERGTYDARTGDSLALDIDDEEPVAEEGARLPLLVGIGLVVLTAFAGIVWLAYTQGVERGRSEAPQVTAQGSIRKYSTAAQTLFTGLNIYQPAARESGRAVPPKTASPIHAANATPTLRPSSSGGSEAFAPGTQVLHPFAEPVAPQPTAAKPSVEAAPKVATIVPKVATAAPKAPDASAVPVPPQLSGTLLQIGSYKSLAEALQSWRAFKARHSAAAAYQFDIKVADLGGKGRWYRLRIGPFDDKDSAAEACTKLKTDGASCILAR